MVIGGFVIQTFGVMYLEFIEYYSASPSSTAWIVSLATAIMCTGGTRVLVI